MKTIRCSSCGKILGFSNNSDDNKFFCVLCAEEKEKEKEKKNKPGLLMPSGFISINSSPSFVSFGKKPKPTLNRFIVNLYICNAISVEKCKFFDRDGISYKIAENEYLVEIVLPNKDTEYYLVKSGEIIDHTVIKH